MQLYIEESIDILINSNWPFRQFHFERFIRIPKKERIFCLKINLVAIFEQKGPANEWNDFGTLGLGRHSCSAPVIIMHSMHNSGMTHLTMWCMVWCCGGAWWRFIFLSSDHTPAPFLSIMCMHKRSLSKKGKNQQSPQKLQLTSSVPYAIVRVPSPQKYLFSILKDTKSMKQIYPNPILYICHDKIIEQWGMDVTRLCRSVWMN